MRFLILAILYILVSGCGGASGSPEAIENPLSATSGINISKEGTVFSVTWPAVDGAKFYNVYYAEEPITDIENYSVFHGSKLLTDVQNGIDISIEDIEPVYYFVVTAHSGTKEGIPSDIQKFAPRYELSGVNNEFVKDLVNRRIWSRCYYGQQWNDFLQQCEGAPIRMNLLTALQTAASLGVRVPTEVELASLSYCKAGAPNSFQSKIATGVDKTPCSAPRIYSGVFTDQVISSSLIVDDYCIELNQTFQKSISSLTYTFGGVCLAPKELAALALRPVSTLID